MTITSSPRLILRSFKESDALALLDYLSSPRTPCFQDEMLNSVEDAVEEVCIRANDPSQFAVCLKDSDLVIGHLFAENSGEPDANTWSVGWHFNQRYEGYGYATESVGALFKYLFNVKQARRIYAYVEDYNLSSQRLCSRLGMRQEGCFKEFVSFITDEGEERYENTFVYALLKKEFKSTS